MDRKNEPEVLVDGGGGSPTGEEQSLPTVFATSVEAVPVTIDDYDPQSTAGTDTNKPPFAAHPADDTSNMDTDRYQDHDGDASTSSDSNSVDGGGFDCVLCGDTKIRKMKVGSKTMTNFSLSLCGNTYIDLRDSIKHALGKKTKSPLEVEVEEENSDQPDQQSRQQKKEKLVFNVTTVRLCGDTKILVPPGTIVKARRIMLCGDRHIDVEPVSSSSNSRSAPARGAEVRAKLIVNILMLCGSLRVTSDVRDWDWD